MKNIIRELLIKGLISESKKTEYQYQIRNIGGSDVYYKRKQNDKLWDFIEKNEFDKNSTKENIIKDKKTKK
jgi:hypothetical protein